MVTSIMSQVEHEVVVGDGESPPIGLGVLENHRGQFPIDERAHLVSVAIAAERSNMDPHHLRRLIRSGAVPYRTYRGMYYIDKEDLPIDPTRVRKPTEFRQYVADLIAEDGLLESVDEAYENYILTEYADGATLVSIADGVRNMTDGAVDVTRQRIHQIIKEIVDDFESSSG